MPFLKILENNQKPLFFFLLIIFTGYIQYPYLDYQSNLAQGDHGRDLYCFWKTMRGGLPYKDYWWVYGPLMPYYYSLFFKIVGINILSVLLGKMLLMIGASALVYLILLTIVPSYIAFIGGLWFCRYNPDFFFTYNHIGGIFFMLLTVYFLFRYLKEPRIPFLYLSLASIFLLGLVKINFAVSSLAALVCSVALIDWVLKNPSVPRKKIFYAAAIILVPCMLLWIYFLFTHGLTVNEIRQCFPYMKGDEPYHNDSIFWSSIQFLFHNGILTIRSNFINLTLSFFILLSIVQTAISIVRNRTQIESKQILLAGLVLAGFYIVNLHEYLLSGVMYRSFWSQPFWLLLMFIVMAVAIKSLTRPVRVLAFLTLILCLARSVSQDHTDLQTMKAPWHYLGVENGKVFVQNDPFWVQTVLETTKYLKEHIPTNEKFFALPYEPLYYFLAQKDSPTRQLIFFDHIRIPAEQEQRIIAELERQHVNWVLISSRLDSTEQGLGTFGKTYCPLLSAYIEKNFAMEIQFGDWINPPGWAWCHGTRVLKRRVP